MTSAPNHSHITANGAERNFMDIHGYNICPIPTRVVLVFGHTIPISGDVTPETGMSRGRPRPTRSRLFPRERWSRGILDSHQTHHTRVHTHRRARTHKMIFVAYQVSLGTALSEHIRRPLSEGGIYIEEPEV